MKVEVICDIFDEGFSQRINWLKAQGVSRIGVEAPLSEDRMKQSLDRLQEAAEEIHMKGLETGGVKPPWGWIDHAADSPAEVDMLGKMIETAAKMGIDRVILSCFRRDVTGLSAVERSTVTDRVYGIYRDLCALAAAYGMKLCTHTSFSFFKKGTLFDTMEDYDRFFDQVPSEANGLLFCIGPTDLMGYSVIDCIRHFRDRICAVHGLRELPASVRGAGDAWKGHVEIETDRIALNDVVRAFHDAGYDGPLIPEHYPVFSGPCGHETGLAWAIGYLRATLADLTRSLP